MSTRPESTEVLNEKRRRAVEMRLAGSSLAAIRRETGLSAPTVISAYKAFVAGGWPAVPVKGLGRRVGQGRRLLPDQEQALREAIFSSQPAAQGLANPLWSAAAVQAFLRARWNLELAESTVLRYLAGWGLDLEPLRDVRPANATERRWLADELPRHLNRARARREKIFWAGQLAPGDGRARILCATSLRGRPVWLPADGPQPGGRLHRLPGASAAGSGQPGLRSPARGGRRAEPRAVRLDRRADRPADHRRLVPSASPAPSTIRPLRPRAQRPPFRRRHARLPFSPFPAETSP